MDSNISLHRLRVFCLVIDAGGVTRAAERLFVAQPAVSAQIRALEKALGAELFSRRGNSLLLTEAGARAYQWAKQALAEAAVAGRDLNELTTGAAGSVSVAASMGVGSYLIPPIMARLRAERPGADITVHVGEPTAMLQAAVVGEADFAVTTWTRTWPDELTAESLWRVPIVLCASPHGPPEADVVDLAEITRLPYVGVPRGVAFHDLLDEQLAAHGIDSVPHVLRLGHSEPIKRAIEQYGWVGLAPEYAIADEVAAGRLRTVEIRDVELSEEVGLYLRRDAYLSPLKTAALEALRAARPTSVSSRRGPAA